MLAHGYWAIPENNGTPPIEGFYFCLIIARKSQKKIVKMTGNPKALL